MKCKMLKESKETRTKKATERAKSEEIKKAEMYENE
jgi:hypothetical protein